MTYVYKATGALLLLLVAAMPPNSFALGKFSRVCNVSEYSLAFPMTGIGNFIPYYQHFAYHLFESITIDWGKSRYILVAANVTYILDPGSRTWVYWNRYPTDEVGANWRNFYRARSGTGYVPNPAYLLNGFLFTGEGNIYMAYGFHEYAEPGQPLVPYGETRITHCNVFQWGLEFQAGW